MIFAQSCLLTQSQAALTILNIIYAPSSSNDYNTDYRQPYNSLLAGNDLFRRGSSLSRSADCSRQISAANQVREEQDAALRVRHRSDY